MKLPRRNFLHLAAGAAALPAVLRFAWAQAYPSRPVRILVGFAAGGSSDIVARLAGQWLAERLGQPFFIENRIGAGTNLATEAVVRAPADGHTLLLATVSNAINATLYDKLNFNFIRDITPVAGLSREPNVMLVHPLVPAKTVPEFIAYAEANPGKVVMASGGHGAPSHASGELFKMMTGVNMLHVPYRGGAPALTGVLVGEVDYAMVAVSTALTQVGAGRVRALGVTSARPTASLPNVPPIASVVPGYEGLNFHGLHAPARTAKAVTARLHEETTKILRRPEVHERLNGLAMDIAASRPDEYRAFIKAQMAQWTPLVKASGARVE